MATQAAEKSKKGLFWPKIDDEASALESAKAGAVGGGIVVIGLALELVLTYYSGNPRAFGYDSLQTFYLAQTAQIAVAAFLAWRVYTGKGRFAAILLLLWVLAEVAMKLVGAVQLVEAGARINFGWMIMWFFAILSLLHSIRGSWALHRMRRADEVRVA